MTVPVDDSVLQPVDGKFIFQIDPNIRVRFNADGWVEEIGKGGEEDPLGTRLQGHSGGKFDDLYARRIYDLYSRCLMIDIHPKRISEQSVSAGLIMFKDLDLESQIAQRIAKIITIANHHFRMNVKPLA